METNKALIATNKIKYPILTKELKKIDNNTKEREEIIKHGITCYHFLISFNTCFRLCYLAELIQNYSTHKQAKLIAEIMIINSYYYSPFFKGYNSVEQL